jgi:hypothetical protein
MTDFNIHIVHITRKIKANAIWSDLEIVISKEILEQASCFDYLGLPVRHVIMKMGSTIKHWDSIAQVIPQEEL